MLLQHRCFFVCTVLVVGSAGRVAWKLQLAQLISVLPVVKYVLCWIGTKLDERGCPLLISVRLLRAGEEAGAVIAAMPCILGRTVLLASF